MHTRHSKEVVKKASDLSLQFGGGWGWNLVGLVFKFYETGYKTISKEVSIARNMVQGLSPGTLLIFRSCGTGRNQQNRSTSAGKSKRRKWWPGGQMESISKKLKSVSSATKRSSQVRHTQECGFLTKLGSFWFVLLLKRDEWVDQRNGREQGNRSLTPRQSGVLPTVWRTVGPAVKEKDTR